MTGRCLRASGTAIAYLMRGAALAAAGGFAAAASAQDHGSLQDEAFVVSRNISVRDRPRPAYTPVGARLGSFVLQPRVEVREELTDNIYAIEDKTSDLVTVIAPQATLSSDWSRHSLSLQADAEIDRALRRETENVEQFGLVADGRLDIRHDLDARLRLGYGEFVVERTSSNTLEVPLEPTEFRRIEISGQIRKEFNRVRLIGRISYVELNYDNGVLLADRVTPVIEDDRDRNIIDPHLRAEYALTPDTIFYAEGGYTRKQYRIKVPLDRDSQGGDFYIGIRRDITALLRANLAIGYAKRFFTLPLVDIGGFTFKGRIEYFPTQLITVTIDGERGIEDVASVQAGGMLETRIGARVDYELLRNLLINANVNHLRNDYRSYDRRDRQTWAGIGAKYLVGRNYELGLGYNFRNQRSRGALRTRDFDQSLAFASLTLKL